MLTITIDRRLENPVYEQVADQLRQLIASGDLAAGTVLPTVRQLAGDLGVSLNTVARAYRLLDEEGFLLIRDRAGVEVAPPARKAGPSTRAGLLDEMRANLARLRQAGMSTTEILRLLDREVRALGSRSREGDHE